MELEQDYANSCLSLHINLMELLARLCMGAVGEPVRLAALPDPRPPLGRLVGPGLLENDRTRA